MLEAALRAALAELGATGASGVTVERELARMERCLAALDAPGRPAGRAG